MVIRAVPARSTKGNYFRFLNESLFNFENCFWHSNFCLVCQYVIGLFSQVILKAENGEDKQAWMAYLGNEYILF